MARYFDGSYCDEPPHRTREALWVADRVRTLLGVPMEGEPASRQSNS